jgi:hypothetical protein
MDTFFEVPNILKSRSFDELRLLMLDNNMRLGGKVLYEIKPPTTKNGFWYAVYYDEMNTQQIIKEQLEKSK